MRKFSLLMLLTALFACLSASATDYYLIGGFNNWKLNDPSCRFTAKGDGTYELNYSGTLTSGFKINDGTWNNDNANFGSNGSPLVVGTEYICGTGGSSGNITMSGAVNNPKLTFNPTTASLLITGSAGTVTVSYAIHGCLASTEWESTSMTESNGVWTASNVVVSNSAAEFGIKKLENNNQSDWYAAAEAVTVSGTTTITLTNSNTVNIEIATGTYDFSFNPSTLKLTITKQGGENPPVNPPTPPTEGFKVYFDDFDGWSDGAPHIWAWNDGGNLTTGEWPGPAMTLVSGTVYVWECDQTPTGIIITNDQEVKAGGGNINNPENGATYYRNGTTTKPQAGVVEVKYCLHGNWDGGIAWNDVQLTGSGSALEAKNVAVTGDAVEFGVRKLEDSVGTEWYAAQSATTVSGSTTITLTNVEPVNIGIAAGNYDFSFNTSTLVLTVTKLSGENPPVNPPTPGELKVGIVGSMEESNWDISAPILMTKSSDNVYTVSFNTIAAGTTFKVAITENDTWTWDNTFGAEGELGQAEASNEAVELNVEANAWFGSSNNFLIEQGLANAVITFAYETDTTLPSTIVVTGEMSQSAVESIETVEAPVFYNLNGVRVDNPTTGIYVVRQGDKVTKVIR